MRFRVQLEHFAGPLDLLLYLVRKHELDPLSISITTVIDQYLDIVSVLEAVDVDAAADFLEIATRLMEMKSRQMLPRPDETAPPEEELESPGQDLVTRLLEYKQFKEAAVRLDEQSHRWQRRFVRRVRTTDEDPLDPADQPICQVEMWDLVSALGRVLQRQRRATPTKIRYDDTPIEVHMQRLEEQLAESSPLRFADLFRVGMHRSQLAGMFLALLELIRHGRALASQDALFGDIWISRPDQP